MSSSASSHSSMPSLILIRSRCSQAETPPPPYGGRRNQPLHTANQMERGHHTSPSISEISSLGLREVPSRLRPLNLSSNRSSATFSIHTQEEVSLQPGGNPPLHHSSSSSSQPSSHPSLHPRNTPSSCSSRPSIPSRSTESCHTPGSSPPPSDPSSDSSDDSSTSSDSMEMEDHQQR